MTHDDQVDGLCYDDCSESTRTREGKQMRHVPAHYDGTKVVLDEPVTLPVNTPLEVVVPDSPEEGTQLREGTFLASLPVLTRIWTNSADAEYDKL